MREIFTYGTVGRAPGNRCLYPEDGRAKPCGFDVNLIDTILDI
jgi:hypothetical protein